MDSLDPIEPFRKAFEKKPFFWDQYQNYLVYLLKNTGTEYKTFALEKLYTHTQMFRLAFLNFDAVFVKNENEECDVTMEAFKTYHNELVDELVSRDGDKVEKYRLFKLE